MLFIIGTFLFCLVLVIKMKGLNDEVKCINIARD